MEYDRKPQNKPTQLWSNNMWKRRQDYTMLEWQSLQQMVLGKLDSYMKKNEVRPFFNTKHKNKFKMD